MKTTIHIGKRLAGGGTSEVYESTSGFVVKLYHQAVRKQVVFHEFENLVSAYGLDLPVPKPDRAFEAGGRYGIRMQRIDGENLLELILSDADAATAGGRLLASAHAGVHACAGNLFTSLRKRMATVLAAFKHRNPVYGTRVWSIFESLPDGGNLCHGDLHPANILFRKGEGVVVDWFDAACGPVEADVARTLVILDFGRPTDVDNRVRRNLRESYLSHYRTLVDSVPDQAVLETWYTVILATRMLEPVSEIERKALQGALGGRLGVGGE